MITKLSTFFLLLGSTFFANQSSANEKIQAYFSNDSINGLKLSDAYETHNMGLIYSTDKYYLKLDLGIVSPDMLVYRNQYREANRSFGELISLEIGQPTDIKDTVQFYARIKTTDDFGIDSLQDFAHRLLSLQQINAVNELIRMPSDAWIGIGVRSMHEPSIQGLKDIKLSFDGFVGTDTTFLNAQLSKELQRPFLTYDLSLGGRLVAYDKVVSASPINAKERNFIPVVSFGMSYDIGPYSFYVRDTFSLPSIETDSNFYGVLSSGVSYKF